MTHCSKIAGSDFDLMRKHHQIHEDNEQRLVRALRDRGVETRLCKRFDYSDANIRWADIVFTAGGDGTYLMGASKILSDQKPLVGVNTDASRSEGYLCLPRYARVLIRVDVYNRRLYFVLF